MTSPLNTPDVLRPLTANEYFNFPCVAFGDKGFFVLVPRRLTQSVIGDPLLMWVNTECSWARRRGGHVYLPIEIWDSHWAAHGPIGYAWDKVDEPEALEALASIRY